MHLKGKRIQVALTAAIAMVATWVVAVALPRDFAVGNFVDDAHYVVLAKSLRERATYRTLNIPGEPFETKYPPGFPLLLAAVWSPDRSDLENLDRSRWVNLILIGPTAGALAAFGVMALSISPPTAAGLAIASVTLPSVVTNWTVPLSGMLSLLVVLVGWLIAERGKPGWRILGLAAAIYVRSVAGAFALAWLLFAWIRKRDGRHVDTVVFGITLLPWLAWQFFNRHAVPGELLGLYGSYGKWYLDSLFAEPVTVLFRVPAINLRDVLIDLGGGVMGGFWISPILLAVIGFGVVWRIWAGRTVNATLASALGIYCLVVLLWPFPPDRFVVGVLPIVVLITGASLGKSARILAVGLLGVSIITLVRGEAVRGHRARSDTVEQLTPHADSLVQNDDIIASTNAALYYLRYDVPSVPVQRMRSYRSYRLGYWSTSWGLGDDAWALVSRYGATKAIVEARGVEGRFAVGSLMNRCPGVVSPLWEGDAGFVFDVDVRVGCG